MHYEGRVHEDLCDYEVMIQMIGSEAADKINHLFSRYAPLQ